MGGWGCGKMYSGPLDDWKQSSLDTSFHEDESQIYKGYSQENLSVIRKIGQKLLKAETTFKGGSVRRKAKRVAMLNDYAEKILMLGDQLLFIDTTAGLVCLPIFQMRPPCEGVWSALIYEVLSGIIAEEIRKRSADQWLAEILSSLNWIYRYRTRGVKHSPPVWCAVQE